MNSNSKKAFSLMEALIGLAVFSWMLSLYVPGYIQHIHLLQEKQIETIKWNNFYQLIQQTLGQEKKSRQFESS